MARTHGDKRQELRKRSARMNQSEPGAPRPISSTSASSAGCFPLANRLSRLIAGTVRDTDPDLGQKRPRHATRRPPPAWGTDLQPLHCQCFRTRTPGPVFTAGSCEVRTWGPGWIPARFFQSYLSTEIMAGKWIPKVGASHLPNSDSKKHKASLPNAKQM